MLGQKIDNKDLNFFQEIEREIKTKENIEAVKNKLLGFINNNKDSNNAMLHYFMGCYAYDLQNYDTAISSLEKSSKLDPEFLDSLYMAGMVYYKRKAFINALQYFQHVYKKGFRNEFIHGLISICLFNIYERQPVKALEFMEEQKRLFPDTFKNFLSYYSSILAFLGEADLAADTILETVKEFPQKSTQLYSDAVMTLAHSISYTDQDILKIAELKNKNTLSNIKSPYKHQKRDRKVPRIGVLFPYHKSSVSDWVLDLFKARSSDFFYAAYNNAEEEDQASKDIKENADIYRYIRQLDAQTVAELIYKDEIDILLDLRTNVRGERADVMKLKPSPIQATWLDSFPPSGLPEMDYVIYDKYLVPPEDEKNFNEKVARLPFNYFYYKKPDYEVIVKDPPCLNNGYITFGSFHRPNKINKPLLKAWSEILKRVKDSKLLIKNTGLIEKAYKDLIWKYFKEQDIDPSRIILEEREDLKLFFEKCNEVDICLDSFPMNGGSTNLRTLWMSKPLIAMRGKRRSCKISYSILKSLELDEFIAYSEEEYIAKAVELANDQERIVRHTQTLRDKLVNSPICQTHEFQKGFEELMLQMWNDYNS